MNEHGDTRSDETGRPESTESDRLESVERELEAEPASTDAEGAGEQAEDSARGEGSDSDEVGKLREAMLRLKAEMENREKRLEREMVKTRKFAVERLVGDLIPVLDSMDQALAAAEAADSDAGTEGLQLTRKQALQVLAAHGLEVLDPVGERFDPTWHEAIATQPGESDADDTVLQVLQKGYRLNERLVRPARVIVAKGS